MKEKIVIITCLKCKNEQEVSISQKTESLAANHDKILKIKCPKCSNIKFAISYKKVVPLDFELLKEWSLHQNLFLMPQDEELFLADEPYLDIILQTLDTVKILDIKKNVLFEALCIIVYDNTIESNLKKSKQLRDRVINELNKRKQKLTESSISDYIKEIVYPQLT